MTPGGRRAIVVSAVAGVAAMAASWLVLDSGQAARAAAQAEAAVQLARQYQAASGLGFMLLQLLAVMVGFVPGALVGMAAGAALGLTQGFAVSSVSVLVGALAAFGLSRSLFRPFVQRLLARRAGARKFDAALASEGWRVVVLLRMSPVAPFAATSYALGLSSVSLRDYVLGSFAALPALFGYVALGALAERGLAGAATSAAPLQWALLSVGFAATALAIAHLGALAARSARSGS